MLNRVSLFNKVSLTAVDSTVPILTRDEHGINNYLPAYFWITPKRENRSNILGLNMAIV